MKIYRILDYDSNLPVGTLIYYEKKKEYIIELEEYTDEWAGSGKC